MALTKTTVIDVVDPWVAVPAATLKTGAAESLSTSYSSMLYIEVCPVEDAVEQSGMDIIIEVSYADDNWTTFTTLKSSKATSNADTLNGGESAGDTAMDLTDSTGYDTKGQLWLIYDGTIANSEVVRTKSDNIHEITVCYNIKHDHADTTPTHTGVDHWAIELPLSAAQVRVLYNNTDANCDMAVTSRISKVTDLG